MPHPRSYDRDYGGRQRAHSPSTITASNASDPYDRYSRALQPYQSSSHRPRDSRAVQPYQPSSHTSRPLARRRSDSYLGSQHSKTNHKDQSVGWMKDHGAELIGAAAGGYAGRRAGTDDHLRTASGAAVGAIGGKVLERGYRRWNDKREDKKVGREVRNGGRDSHDRYGGGYGYDDEYSPSPRRYSRSLDRGRERDRTPQGWRDMCRQLKRSLSRK